MGDGFAKPASQAKPARIPQAIICGATSCICAATSSSMVVYEDEAFPTTMVRHFHAGVGIFSTCFQIDICSEDSYSCDINCMTSDIYAELYNTLLRNRWQEYGITSASLARSL